MEILSVILAAAAAWVFGAIWYMVLSRSWMEAQGIDENQIDRRNPLPYVMSFLLLVVVAGMVRHVLTMSGITAPGAAILSGLGLGAFVAAPWVAMGVLYSNRGVSLIWIDGLYPVIGCAIIALVLALF